MKKKKSRKPVAMLSEFGLGGPDVLYVKFDSKSEAQEFAGKLRREGCHIKHPARKSGSLSSYPYTQTWNVEFQCPGKYPRSFKYMGPKRR